jgi:hypothetical protein
MLILTFVTVDVNFHNIIKIVHKQRLYIIKMDGDKYNKQIIDYIKILSISNNTEEFLNEKRSLCVLINGQSQNSQNKSKWNRSISTGELDIVYKPQFIHSAAAIFMLIKYPHLRKNDSFIDIVINSNLTKECLKIALDVLTVDDDCSDFITNSEKIFNSEMIVTIIDEINI